MACRGNSIDDIPRTLMTQVLGPHVCPTRLHTPTTAHQKTEVGVDLKDYKNLYDLTQHAVQ
jgi:hypothetical protein